ncbi:MAG TPA: hypothetical protein VHF89_01570 [Solirubrobacteraceae bacterium]|nr:hypothetical protein [Solirubrobacteraceae bacterium]
MWLETDSEHFTARHSELDAEGAAAVLALLEQTRERLRPVLHDVPDGVSVVLHGTTAQLHVAQPLLPLAVRATAPASRRYLVGWPGRDAVHVLAPGVLEERASGVPGSREMLLLAPAALYAQLAIRASNPRLRRGRRLRWAWLVLGAAQYLSGQTAHARPAVKRRLHEGPEPSFPPALRDAHLLGGTVVDLLAREEGDEAVAGLVAVAGDAPPRETLVRAFHGRDVRHTEAAWRAHLARLAGHEPA